jgi:hypothetical protein
MYKIIGANQVEYGPITADQLRAWLAEGRVNAQTPVQAEGDTTWKPLSMFPEFAAALPTSPLPAPAPMGATVTGDGRAQALSMVSGPAIGLIVAVSIGIALALVGIILQMLGMGMAGMSGFENTQNAEAVKMMQMMSGGLGIVIRCVGILVGFFIIYGCVKMKKLENHGLSLAVSIVAMLPCLSPCCCIGLPIGIWALVVLNKPEVKQYFS